MSGGGRMWVSTEWGRRLDRYLIGDVGLDGEQLPLPGMPTPPMSVTLRGVTAVLVTWSSPDGVVTPGRTRLARRMGVSEGTIRRVMRELTRLELLTVITPGHRRRPTEYRLVLDGLLANVSINKQRGVTHDPPKQENGGSSMTPHSTERGVMRAPKGGSPMTPPIEEEGGAALYAATPNQYLCAAATVDDCDNPYCLAHAEPITHSESGTA